MAEKSKQQVTPEGRPEAIDFSRYIKDWAVKYGFNAQQAKEEIDKWIAEIEKNQNDLYKLGLAAFAKKNFGEASKLFNESAEYQGEEVRRINRKRKTVNRESCARLSPCRRRALQQLRLRSGIDMPMNAPSRYVSIQQTPQLWAATLIDIGRANWELGIRAEGPAFHRYLTAAVKAFHQALEVYTREQLPQDWAMTQNNLGVALRRPGHSHRRGGGARTCWRRPSPPTARPWKCAPASSCRSTGPRRRTTWGLRCRSRAFGPAGRRARSCWRRPSPPTARPWKCAPASSCRRDWADDPEQPGGCAPGAGQSHRRGARHAVAGARLSPPTARPWKSTPASGCRKTGP